VDASQVLGSPQIAGLIVMGKGSGASAYRAVSIGNPIEATSIRQGQEAIRRRRQPPSDVVFDIHGGGFLALTAQDLALVGGRGYSKVVACMPRRESAFAKQYGSAFPTTAPFVIVFKNGHGWYFEVQWNRWRAAKKILRLLNAEQQASQSWPAINSGWQRCSTVTRGSSSRQVSSLLAGRGSDLRAGGPTPQADSPRIGEPADHTRTGHELQSRLAVRQPANRLRSRERRSVQQRAQEPG
jgi:hypothetical protein